MKYEIYFNGSVFVDAEDEEIAMSKATEYLNENVNHYCEIRKMEE